MNLYENPSFSVMGRCGPVLKALNSGSEGRVRGTPGETSPCTLMAPDAFKICAWVQYPSSSNPN